MLTCMWQLQNLEVWDWKTCVHGLLHGIGQPKVPWLLLHGTEDDVVLIQDSIDIEAKATCEHDFITIEGADHSFSDHMPAMTEAAVAWIEKHLK